LLYYRGADIVARRDGLTLEQARDSISATLPDTTGWSAAAIYDLYAREGAALVKRHPWLFVQGQIYGLLKMMLVPGECSFVRYLGISPEKVGPIGDLVRMWDARHLAVSGYVRKWLVERPVSFVTFLYALFYLLFLYVGVLAFFVSLGKRCLSERRCVLPVAYLFVGGILLYFPVVSAGPEAYSRFRVPIIPFLALYAGVGISAFSTRLAGAHRVRSEDSGGVSLEGYNSDV
jgi:hypothetical protein